MSSFYIIILIILNSFNLSQFEKYDVIVIPISKISKSKHFLYSPPFQRQKLAMRNNEEISEEDIEFHGETKEHIDTDLADSKDVDYVKTKESTENFALGYGEDKIVGGLEVDINLYPYHVEYGTNCGGAIISNKWVVTAGHCGKKAYIRYGSKYNDKGQIVRVKQAIIHPMWTAANKEHPFDFDFQLLELQEPISFSENAQPIKIAHIENMVIGTIITVTGWGHTSENGKYSNVLRAIRVPVISKEHCQKVRFPYFRGQLTPRMFCAGFPDGKKDACQGDSGGPAVANGRLLGTVSFGYGCATPGSYGVYSKLAKVRNWIEQITHLKLD